MTPTTEIDIFGAIKRQDMKAVIQYIAQQSDLNIKNSSNQTVVQYAASFAGNSPIAKSIYQAIGLKLFWDRVNYARSMFVVFWYGFFQEQEEKHLEFLDSCNPKFFRYFCDIWADYVCLDICRFADKRPDCFTARYWLKEVFSGSIINLAPNAKTAYASILDIAEQAKDARDNIIAHTSRAALYENTPLSQMPNGAKDFETYYQSMEVLVNEIAAKIGNGMTIRYGFLPLHDLGEAPGEEVIKLLKLGMEKREEQLSRRAA